MHDTNTSRQDEPRRGALAFAAAALAGAALMLAACGGGGGGGSTAQPQAPAAQPQAAADPDPEPDPEPAADPDPEPSRADVSPLDDNWRTEALIIAGRNLGNAPIALTDEGDRITLRDLGISFDISDESSLRVELHDSQTQADRDYKDGSTTARAATLRYSDGNWASYGWYYDTEKATAGVFYGGSQFPRDFPSTGPRTRFNGRYLGIRSELSHGRASGFAHISGHMELDYHPGNGFVHGRFLFNDPDAALLLVSDGNGGLTSNDKVEWPNFTFDAQFGHHEHNYYTTHLNPETGRGDRTEVTPHQFWAVSGGFKATRARRANITEHYLGAFMAYGHRLDCYPAGTPHC